MLLLAENAKDHFTKFLLWNRRREKRCAGFSLGHLHMGGQVQGDKVLIGELMRGDIDPMGGPNFDRLYQTKSTVNVKLQWHNAIYRLWFY